jgi:tripartite-type tricarboxylate transporter receptor subunit TctC
MKIVRKIRNYSMAVLAMTSGFALAAHADAISDFYKGKDIVVYVGSGPGGGYDTYARMMGRHMGRHIPSNPNFIVKNMDGAGSIIAANYVYNVAPQDGTVIAALQRNAPIVQIMGQKGPKFEATKFNWLGSFNNEVGIIAVAKRTGVKKFEDLYGKEVLFGSTGPNDTEFYPALIANTLAAKVRLIKGYPSTPPTHLAMERGEVDAISQSWASFTHQSNLYSKGEMVLLAQLSLKPLPELKAKGVPLLMDLVDEKHLQPGYTKEQVQTLYRLLMATKTMGRPFALGPKVPADKVKVLRTAFNKTTEDKKFVDEANKQSRDLSLVTGDEIQDIVEKMASAPKEVLEKLEYVSQWHGPVKTAKVEIPKHTGKITKIEKGGRKITVDAEGKKVSAKISGSRTKIKVGGKAAKRSAFKEGMTCSISLPPGSKEATAVDCKG